MRAQIVGGGEHLQRPGDVEQLDVREGQHLDAARLWRKTRGLWHVRQMVIALG